MRRERGVQKKKTVKEKEDKVKKVICQFMETFVLCNVLQVGEVCRIGGKRKEG